MPANTRPWPLPSKPPPCWCHPTILLGAIQPFYSIQPLWTLENPHLVPLLRLQTSVDPLPLVVAWCIKTMERSTALSSSSIAQSASMKLFCNQRLHLRCTRASGPGASSASPRVRWSPGPAEMHSWSATTLPRCIMHHKFCAPRILLSCIMHLKLCSTRTLHILRHILCTSAAHGLYF